MNRIVLASLSALAASTACATPVTYDLDPHHTFPSFAVDHMGGLSVRRGLFTDTSGKVVYDKAAKSGSIEVTVNMSSVDTGYGKLDEDIKSPEMLDIAKFPTATYSGQFTQWNGDAPTEAQGTFTLHGVSKPLTLKIDSFMCKMSPMSKKEVCGANATAMFNRSDYGVTYGDSYGFKMWVKLEIQVEGSPAG